MIGFALLAVIWLVVFPVVAGRPAFEGADGEDLGPIAAA
jgi:hypothetical protein